MTIESSLEYMRRYAAAMDTGDTFFRHITRVLDAAASSQTAYLRPEVLAFARLMEQQLRAIDHKPGWQNDTPKALMQRLDEEVQELDEALIHSREQIAKEAADVANFALMIADVSGCLGEKA